MKKNRIRAAIVFVSIMSALASADVILPNTRVVPRCVKIGNTAGFPDIVVVGYVKAVTSSNMRYVVNQDSCLTKGYKFNSFYVIWTAKSYFDSLGLDSLPIDAFINGLAKKNARTADSPLHLFSTNIALNDSTVPDSSTLVWEKLKYLLYPNGSNIALNLSQKISHFSDSTEEIEDYDYLKAIKPSQGRAVRNGSIENIFIRNGIFTLKAEFTGKLDMSISDCKGRIVGKFIKSCLTGCTYVTNFTGLKSGLYWLRLKGPSADVTKQLTIIQ
jgi:hypothetical protein